MNQQRGFTLVELLVVVLIIGILSAIAIPMYQGAVDKSHWSTMLPASKAIKDAEEAFKMTNGYYTSNMDDLDVRMNSTDLDFVLDIKDSLSEPNVIKVTNSKLDTVRLANYLDDSPKFAGQLHCEAKNEGSTPNERGARLCGKLLNGEELTKTTDNYTAYLLDQSINQAICKDAGLVWSKKQNHCYKTNQERCTANGMTSCTFSGSGTEDNLLIVEEGGNCYGGWTCNYVQVNDGGACTVRDYGPNQYVSGCQNGIFNQDSKCISSQPGPGCTNGKFYGATCEGGTSGCSGEFHNNSVCTGKASWSCSGTFDSGSICRAEGGYGTCSGTFKEGSKCIAAGPDSCGNNYYKNATYDGGCCEEGVPGRTYCPSWAPKC